MRSQKAKIRTSNNKFIIAIFILMHMFSSLSCDDDSKGDQDNTGEYDNAVGSLAINTKGSQVLKQVNLALVEEGEIEQTQADDITVAAADSLILTTQTNQQTLNLSVQQNNKDLNDMTTIPQEIMQALIAVIMIQSLDLSDNTLKRKLIAISSGAIVESCATQCDELSDEDRKNLPSKLSNAGIKVLKQNQVSTDELAAFAGSIMNKTISKLKKGGFTSSDFTSILSSISQQSLIALNENEITRSEMTNAMEYMFQDSFKAFSDLELTQEDPSLYMKPFMSGAVASFNEIGLDNNDKRKRAVEKIMKGSISSFESLGFENIDIINQNVGSLLDGTMEGFQNESYEPQYYSEIINGAMIGTMRGLENLNFQEMETSSAYKEVSTFTSGYAISQFEDWGLNDKDQINSASQHVAQGIMEGYGYYYEQDLITVEQWQDASQKITETSIEKLYEYRDTYFEDEDFGALSQSYTTGLQNGLAAKGLSQEKISSFNDPISEGYSQGLIKTDINQSDIDIYTQELSTKQSDFVERLSERCPNEWNENTQSCEYRVAIEDMAYIDSSEYTPASQQQQKQCDQKNGFLSYDTTTKTYICTLYETNEDIVISSQSYKDPATEYDVPARDYQDPATDYQDPATDYKDPATEYKDPATEYKDTKDSSRTKTREP